MNTEDKRPWTFAQVILQARAGADGVLRYTPAGKPVFSVSVAINKGPKDNRRTVWLTVKAFQELAENTVVRKGDLVNVEGDLDISSWTDKLTGAHKERIEILATSISVLPRDADLVF